MIADDFATILDGPLYERSPLMVDLLLPIIPTPEEVHAEFRARLHRAVDGVEIVPAPATPYLVTGNRDGTNTQHQRRKLYGRATFDVMESMFWYSLGKTHDEERAALFRVEVADRVRGPVFALARLFAERIAAQVVDLRAERAHLRSAFAEPRLEPIVVSVHGATPRLLGSDCDRPLIGISDLTADAFAIFGAYYFVTPVSVEPKEPR